MLGGATDIHGALAGLSSAYGLERRDALVLRGNFLHDQLHEDLSPSPVHIETLGKPEQIRPHCRTLAQHSAFTISQNALLDVLEPVTHYALMKSHIRFKYKRIQRSFLSTSKNVSDFSSFSRESFVSCVRTKKHLTAKVNRTLNKKCFLWCY